MLNFLRKFRRKNINSKYLKYAIGEIALVVIGILVALGINNWNQERLERKKEDIMLSELHQEFVANKQQLDTMFFYQNRALQSAIALIEMFPIDINKTPIDSLERTIYYLHWHYTFNPSQGVINSIVNTSSFDLITNDSLRRIIISWPDIYNDYREEEVIAVNNYYEVFLPYFTQHMRFSTNGIPSSLSDKRIDKGFLKSLVFENMINARRLVLRNQLSVDEFNRIRDLIDEIIDLTKPTN